MKAVVIVNPPRADLASVDALADLGVATVHEAVGRSGYLGPSLRPIYDDARAAGTALTVVCAPGDNLMLHVAVEQAAPGDIVVLTTTSPCSDGYFGELLATTFTHRGVRGLVTTTGIRDVAELRAMKFPVWSSAISAQGTVKATAGAVNVPVAIGGVTINPGDVIIADQDGVLCVARDSAAAALVGGEQRIAKEAATRAAFRSGELGLDRYGLRPLLTELGVEYLNAADPAVQVPAQAAAPPDQSKATTSAPIA